MGKNKKNISNCRLLKFLPKELSLDAKSDHELSLITRHSYSEPHDKRIIMPDAQADLGLLCPHMQYRPFSHGCALLNLVTVYT